MISGYNLASGIETGQPESLDNQSLSRISTLILRAAMPNTQLLRSFICQAHPDRCA